MASDSGESASRGERCQRCSSDYLEWWAPHDLWEPTHGAFNLLCPACFDRLSAARLCWIPFLHDDVGEAIGLDTQRAIAEWQARSTEATASLLADAFTQGFRDGVFALFVAIGAERPDDARDGDAMYQAFRDWRSAAAADVSGEVDGREASSAALPIHTSADNICTSPEADTCGFCLEPWASHSEHERLACEADLQAIEDQHRRLGWWSISGEALLDLLRQAHAGGDPDLLYAEHYANSDHEAPSDD